MRHWLLTFTALVLSSGCYGFAGGGLPAHVKTVAVLPLDNETAAPELPLELQAALKIGDEVQRAEALRLLDSLPKS
jgi:hypothetical protein